jgi:8-oxo-dGTP pyrophosphatase MutT (NUDIX family)
MERKAELLEELRQYQPADAVEAGHKGAMLDLLSYGRDPFSRHGFEPGHITASCFIVDPSSRRVLLHRHRRLDRWLQMGGHVDEGESTRAAALREASEESGLKDLELIDGVMDLDVHTIPSGKGEPDHMHYDVRFVARTSQPEAIIIARAESSDLAWVDLIQAVSLMNEEGSRRVIMKIRKML